MTLPFEISGAVVDQIRDWRRQGSSMPEIVHRLLPARDRQDPVQHMRAAFCTDSLPVLEILPKDPQGRPRPDSIDAMFEPAVEKARPVWEIAPPYPDLYRRRDRHAFRALAREHGARVLVKSADRRAATFIGRVGYRPAPPELWGMPRSSAPNAGLLAADPADPALAEALARRLPAMTYEEYRAQLLTTGFRLSSQEAGYLIRDDSNQAFYPGYALQGVYSKFGANLWIGRRADEMRLELNERMGEKLVDGGPYDICETRDPAAGPLLPVIIFEPDGNVDVRQTVDRLRAYYRYSKIPWDRLYKEPRP